MTCQVFARTLIFVRIKLLFLGAIKTQLHGAVRDGHDQAYMYMYLYSVWRVTNVNEENENQAS